MFQLRIPAHRMECCFTPEKAQQRIALFGQAPESLALPTGMFARDHPCITGQFLAACESRWITQEHFRRQRRDRSYSRVRHQQARSGSFPSLLLDSLI
jgi:hypothetical protein